MRRCWPLACAFLLAIAGTAAHGQTASLDFGAPGRSGSAVIRCADGRATLSLWARKPPRGVREGEFTTTVRFFQKGRTIGLAARGEAAGDAPVRLDMVLADPAAFLAGIERNGRLVAVSHAGRTMQPLPPKEAVQSFLDACRP